MIIIDFEASSLVHGSYPIEIAWGGIDQPVQSYLIRPSDRWIEESHLWSYEAEEAHGLSIEYVIENGNELVEVAKKAVDSLTSGDAVYSDNPEYDQGWLDILCKEAGIRNDAIEIQDFNKLLLGFADTKMIQDAYYRASQLSPPTHRAARDVEFLVTVYNLCREYSEYDQKHQ